MQSKLIIKLFFGLILILSCNRKEKEVCLNSCPPRSINDAKCECKCDPNLNNLVNAGKAFCVREGSFIAYLPQEDHLDTFGLNVKWQQTTTELLIGHELFLRRQLSPIIGIGFNYKVLSSGDSLYIDMLPPMDLAFHFLAPRDNKYGAVQYRLRFEGFIPKGWNEGDTLHATIHYWAGGNIPVHPSVEFDMIKVR